MTTIIVALIGGVVTLAVATLQWVVRPLIADRRARLDGELETDRQLQLQAAQHERDDKRKALAAFRKMLSELDVALHSRRNVLYAVQRWKTTFDLHAPPDLQQAYKDVLAAASDAHERYEEHPPYEGLQEAEDEIARQVQPARDRLVELLRRMQQQGDE